MGTGESDGIRGAAAQIPVLQPLVAVRKCHFCQYTKSVMQQIYSLFFSPHTHSWSKTAIKDFPLPLRLYSTLGGIWGYSFRMMSRSDSSSFKLLLSVLSDTFLRYRFNSLNLTTSNSIRQYRITILCLPDIRDNV